MSDTNIKSAYLNVEEREIAPLNGILMLFAVIGMLILSIGGMVGSGFALDAGVIALGVVGLVLSIVWFIACCICFGGFHVINPNEALVMTLFGQYYGTIRKPGFYFTNPFAEYSCAVKPPIRQTGNRLSGLTETANASLLA